MALKGAIGVGVGCDPEAAGRGSRRMYRSKTWLLGFSSGGNWARPQVLYSSQMTLRLRCEIFHCCWVSCGPYF